MKWPLLATAIVVTAFGALALLALTPGGGRQIDAAEAQQAAQSWTGSEPADVRRGPGGGWEVDVHRADGSVVEVQLGPHLELLELDEERGPGGGPPHDEVLGELRLRAIAAAHRRAGAGVVRSVEREHDGSIEVDLVRPDRTVVEVELDSRLRFKDVDREELGDE